MMTSQPQEETEPYLMVVVRNPDDMDYDTFRKHMDHRHQHTMGGLRGLPPWRSEYLEDCWRDFHDAVHRLRLYGEMDHEHGQ